MLKNGIILPGLLVIAATGCGGDGGDDLPTTAPRTVELVVEGEFTGAGGIAVSSDGADFWVLASDQDSQPGVFTVDVEAKSAEPLHVGDMFYPSDIAVSCNDETLFVGDMGAPAVDMGVTTEDGMAPPQAGGIHKISTGSGEITKLDTPGLSAVAGIVVSHDCSQLFVSGYTDEGIPGVFAVPFAGGGIDVIHKGEPLVGPTTIHSDADDVIWTMAHGSRTDEGEGALYAITLDGDVTPVAGGLAMGRIGGVSLVPGGVTAVIPVNGEGGRGMLITANTQTGAREVVETPDASFVTGTAAARSAPVMGLATDGGAIFKLGF
jgi:hypothetical protein